MRRLATTENAARYIGIDLSARRGFDVAVLDDERRVVATRHAATLDAVIDDLAAHGERVVVGVDAPQAPSDFPLRRPEVRAGLAPPPPPDRYRRYRVCDYELARRGIGLYLLPELGELGKPGAALPEWMRAGFATFERLQSQGWRLPAHAADHAATLLEVYPYAAFVTLLGGRPPRKTTPAGAAVRITALRAAGVWDLPSGRLSHDTVDALVAAYTAWTWRHGRGCAVGLPEEGLMVLPVAAAALRERYHALVDAAD